MKFFDIYGNEVEKPDDVEVKHRLSVYGVTFLNREKLIFIRGALSGQLELPGGKLELGESFADCLTREGMEECGYYIRPHESLPFHTHGPAGFCIPQFNRFYWSVGLVFRAYAIGWQMPNFVLDTREATEILVIDIDKLVMDDVHSLFRPSVQKAILNPIMRR